MITASDLAIPFRGKSDWPNELGSKAQNSQARRQCYVPTCHTSRLARIWRLLRAHGARRARVSFPAVPRDSQQRSDTCECADAKRTDAVERHPSAANAHRHFGLVGKIGKIERFDHFCWPFNGMESFRKSFRICRTARSVPAQMRRSSTAWQDTVDNSALISCGSSMRQRAFACGQRG
jgi:hypothetical protein